MAATVISESKAQDIANIIAREAFNHLLKPLYEEQETLALKLLKDHLEEVGITMDQLEQVGFLRKAQKGRDEELEKTNLTFQQEQVVLQHDAEDDEDPEYIALKIYTGYTTFSYGGRILIENNEKFGQMKKISETIADFRLRKQRLFEEVWVQLKGKSVKRAIENWPQAAPIIRDVMEVGNSVPMTVPLEVLLGKYLPALSAPAEA